MKMTVYDNGPWFRVHCSDVEKLFTDNSTAIINRTNCVEWMDAAWRAFGWAYLAEHCLNRALALTCAETASSLLQQAEASMRGREYPGLDVPLTDAQRDGLTSLLVAYHVPRARWPKWLSVPAASSELTKAELTKGGENRACGLDFRPGHGAHTRGAHAAKRARSARLPGDGASNK